MNALILFEVNNCLYKEYGNDRFFKRFGFGLPGVDRAAQPDFPGHFILQIIR